MVISENSTPPPSEFEGILEKAVDSCDIRQLDNPDYFKSRTPTNFETDVYEALIEAAEHTPFDGSIKLISGFKFPDITVNNFYGVEVKATTSSRWKSTGNSVLETTRINDVKRIYIFFGQLCNPAAFKWRLYQDCLYDVAVTHSPRYLINMDLSSEATVFEKIGIEYDALRNLDNSIAPIVDHYRKNAKRGEEPWWMGSQDDTIPLTVKLWSDLTPSENNHLKYKQWLDFQKFFHGAQGISTKTLLDGWQLDTE